MKRGTTVYLYELAWILPSIAIPVAMLAVLVVTAFGAHIELPGNSGRVDPTTVAQTPPFDHPGVVQIATGEYRVVVLGQIWRFTPKEIHIPAGSTVHFWATSLDVVHGFFIPRADVNVMLLPGQIARIDARFDKPGEYPIICHEYCGILHHTMSGRVIVEPRSEEEGEPPSEPRS